MRIAVISDVHGNMTALEAVVADLKTVGADLVVHGGDLAANGSRPDQVIDSIQAFGWRGVRGNTDEMRWRPELYEESLRKHPPRRGLRQVLFSECAPATRELVGDARLDWLRTQPTQWQGNGVAVMHASPGDLWRAPLEGSAPSRRPETKRRQSPDQHRETTNCIKGLRSQWECAVVQVNNRHYNLPVEPTVVVCLDGSSFDSIDAAVNAGAAPFLASLIAANHYQLVAAAMPTFTNPTTCQL